MIQNDEIDTPLITKIIIIYNSTNYLNILTLYKQHKYPRPPITSYNEVIGGLVI